MNIIKKTTIIALAASAIVTAPAVSAEEKASFEFATQELQSESSRERMMARLERKARSYCRSGNYSALIPHHTLSKCSDAIEAQWLAAIDSVEMSSFSAHAGTKLADARP
ncbi:UrcA family protein [Parasphingorhabdus flavimaris]|uniref:UrcA family protein n=1 Tax=Parasphingorhabdus flavimaris TaxID=266812 RepID=A0ABX2MYZ6_9SPHN|nr:UrcA family protein [Parasphingorhabdus flavimaris]NVD26678.1 UrcA family protein [Parasphingorhabdus flavimaris]|tara:strand:+ start:86237 stop:86566 length:330 start_codon:yes stop_codon:yes gene_type:complete